MCVVGRAAAIAALTLFTPASAHAGWCLRMNLRFASREPPSILVEALRSTVKSIWQPYGVRFEWANSTGARCEAPQGSFDVQVLHDAEDAHKPSLMVLGSTQIGPPAIDHVPIRINGGSIERLLERLPMDQVMHAAGRPNVGPGEIGRALGRVLAHEVGHVLLAVATHQQQGLMRPSFDAHDLIQYTGRTFTLSPAEVTRLSQREIALDARRRVTVVTAVAMPDSRLPMVQVTASPADPAACRDGHPFEHAGAH